MQSKAKASLNLREVLGNVLVEAVLAGCALCFSERCGGMAQSVRIVETE